MTAPVEIADALRPVLGSSGLRDPGEYCLVDCSVGDPRGPDPLEMLSWQDLRDEIYGGR